jgi:WD40 repeat protein
MGSEIYDLAWSPDGVFFITGSMDNIARIYNAQTGWIPNPTFGSVSDTRQVHA